MLKIIILIGLFSMLALWCLIVDLSKFKHHWLVGCGKQIPPTILYAVLLIFIVVISFYIANQIPQNFSWWLKIEKFFNCHSVFSSVIGTLIGLPIIFIILRPRLVLKKIYIYHTDEDEGKLSLCVANKGFFSVINVQVNVLWVRENYPHACFKNDYDFQNEFKTQLIPFFRPEINEIGGRFSKYDTYSCHGKRSFTEEESKRTANFKNVDTLLCRVQATHSLSGLTRVYEWKFNINEIEGYENISDDKSSNILC